MSGSQVKYILLKREKRERRAKSGSDVICYYPSSVLSSSVAWTGKPIAWLPLP